MTKIKSIDDLREMQAHLQANLDVRVKGDHPELHVQIKVAMGDCGIAAGAKQLMDYMMRRAAELGIDALFIQQDCMGFCDLEPTIEVIMPGKDPVMFGQVDNQRADEILSRFIMKGEAVDGVIPVNTNTVS